MTGIHLYIAFAVPAVFAVLLLESIFLFVRNREAPPWFWTTLAVVQVVLGIQILVGVILFLIGHRVAIPDDSFEWLHYVYGGLFPFALLVEGHRQARKREGVEILIFGIVSLLCLGLTIRALTTGLSSV
ncbi:MAG: hypothetical protein QOG04_567 [Actinomycetota bacterium]|jgi:hypothetical protein|nr:hypothetical protein [Actinomycetota bacterium]